MYIYIYTFRNWCHRRKFLVFARCVPSLLLFLFFRIVIIITMILVLFAQNIVRIFYTCSSIKFALSLRITLYCVNLFPDARAFFEWWMLVGCALTRIYDILCFLNEKKTEEIIVITSKHRHFRFLQAMMVGLISNFLFHSLDIHIFGWLLRFFASFPHQIYLFDCSDLTKIKLDNQVRLTNWQTSIQNVSA